MSFDRAITAMDRCLVSGLGQPCTYLRKTVDDRIATHVVVEKDIQIMGQFVDVMELQTQGSFLVSDVTSTTLGDVVVFADMTYHLKRPVSNDGSIIVVELLPDPELHVGMINLDPMGHLNQFVQHEWSALWQAISTHKSVQ